MGVGQYGRCDRAAIERVIRPAVGIRIAQRGADREPQIGLHGDEAKVEEAMDVSSQRQAVREFMAPAVLPRPDVGGLKDGKRVLVGDSAGAVVRVEDGKAEAGLAKPRSD